uniref:Uncharacterized protein n=1 Tax=Brassica oleracea var. oleracea TaxID=109376 RepID=A0A0D3D6R6_BRAOL
MGSVTKKLQAGADMVANGRNVVLQNKYGPPKIVNDGETVLKEIELEDPLENVVSVNLGSTNPSIWDPIRDFP